jgi:hypothetical protein
MQIVTTKEDKTTPSHSDNNKPSILANSTTSIFGNLTPVNTNTSEFAFTTFGTATTPVTGFQFSTPSSSTTNTSTMFTFGNTPKFSFSDLAKQSSDTKSTTNDTEKRGTKYKLYFFVSSVTFIS